MTDSKTLPASEIDGAEALAQRFHETYERLAPSFGYETREASAKPWADVPDQNKRLMIAVCGEVLAALSPAIPTDLEERAIMEYARDTLRQVFTERAKKLTGPTSSRVNSALHRLNFALTLPTADPAIREAALREAFYDGLLTGIEADLNKPPEVYWEHSKTRAALQPSNEGEG